MDAATLETEIQTDPRALGYAALLAAGNDAGIAALLNAVTGSGAATIALASIDRNTFLKITTAAAIRVATGIGSDGGALAAGAAVKWGAVLAQARAADPGSQIDLTLLPSLGDPSADRVMAPSELAALTTRTGSRAEVLFGPGTIITPSDISFALRGTR